MTFGTDRKHMIGMSEPLNTLPFFINSDRFYFGSAHSSLPFSVTIWKHAFVYMMSEDSEAEDHMCPW